MQTIRDTFVITNGSGEIIDPEGIVFTSVQQAQKYMFKNWDKSARSELAVESLADVLGVV